MTGTESSSCELRSLPEALRTSPSSFDLTREAGWAHGRRTDARRTSVERAVRWVERQPVTPPAARASETVLSALLDDLSRRHTVLHGHLVARFGALMELANEIARAACCESLVWVTAEGPLAAFSRTVVHRIFERDEDSPIAARVMPPADEDGAPSLDVLPGDVVLAFALSGRCRDFQAQLDTANAAGVAVGLIHPEGSAARAEGVRLSLPPTSGRFVVAADMHVSRILDAVARQLIRERRGRRGHRR